MTRTAWIAIVLGSLIGALLGGGLSYAYQSHQQAKRTDDLQSQIAALKNKLAATATPSATATPDPTADWLSYSDTKHGFTLKYPSTGWKVSVTASGSTSVESTAAIPDQALPYALSVTSTATTQSIPDYLAGKRQELATTAAQGGPDVRLKAESAATINGLAAYAISDQKLGPNGCTVDEYFFRDAKGTTIYTVDVHKDLCEGTSYDISDDISIATKIAKTFRLP